MKKHFVLMVGLSALASSAFCELPDWHGTYIGVGNDAELNHDTGKFEFVSSYTLEFTALSPNTLKMKVVNINHTYDIVGPIINSKYFSGRYKDGISSMIIKGKFVGKGRKLKGKFYWSNQSAWSECSFSADKY